MSNQQTTILTPVGRLVAGSCFEPQTTDMKGNPLVIKNGPNAGQPRVDYYIGVAIPKTDPGWSALWQTLKEKASLDFPSLKAYIDPLQSPIANFDFSFKVTDGDSAVPNKAGSVPSQKEGFPGCWVVSFSGGYAPKCYTSGGAEQIVDPLAIKRGYYVRVYATVRGNGATTNAGIYLNHSMVELVGYGPEIVSGPQGDQIFGAAPVAQLPPGASSAPVAPAAALAPQAAPVPPLAPQAAPVPPLAPQAAPVPPLAPQAAPVPPLAPQAAPVPPVAPQVAPAYDILTTLPVKQYVVQGTAYTESDLLAVGYTPEQITALPVA